MKYVIDIPNDGQCQYKYNEDTKELKFPCPRIDPNSFMGLDIVLTGATPYTEPDEDEIRNKAEDEVWKFAKKIGSFNGLAKRDLDECFGHTTIQGVMTTYDTYREAKREYEKWKKSKEEIRVGDEVRYHGNKYVVGYVGADEVYHIVDRNWIRTVVQGDYQIYKTGRHFDEVEDLLKKMGEGK